MVGPSTGLRIPPALQRAFARAVTLALCVSCSSTTRGVGDPPDGGTVADRCEDFTGGYIITDQCTGEKLVCSVEQEGCAAQLSCAGLGSRLMELSGDQVSFTLEAGPCTGALSGDLVDGVCEDGCVFQGLRTTRNPTPPPPPELACGFKVSDVVPNSSGGCDTCAETSCCAAMQACAPRSACSALLGCIKLSCPLTDAVACAQSECTTLASTGGAQLSALATCLESSCPGCGFAAQTP